MFNTSSENAPKVKKQKQLSINQFFQLKSENPFSEDASHKDSTVNISNKREDHQSSVTLPRKRKEPHLDGSYPKASFQKIRQVIVSDSIPSMTSKSKNSTEMVSSVPHSSPLLLALDDIDDSEKTECVTSLSASETLQIFDNSADANTAQLVDSILKDERSKESMNKEVSIGSVSMNSVSDENDSFCPNSPLLFDSEPQDMMDSIEDLHADGLSKTPSPAPPWLGMPFEDLKVNSSCCLPLHELKSSSHHTVLFDTTHSGDEPPPPKYSFYKDAWDSHHVRLPCSPKNVCPSDSGGRQSLANRWELIESSLFTGISSSIDLEEAILTYNSRYANQWSFSALHKFFTDDVDAEYTKRFFDEILPKMINLALSLPRLCTQPIPLLHRQRNHSVTMTQQQIACLLCNAFLCTFPWRNSRRRGSEYSEFPEINFSRLFRAVSSESTVVSEKLKTLIHYFDRVTSEVPNGTVTFERRCLDEFPSWNRSPCQLCGLHLRNEGRIEKEGAGMLQVDFANRYIGGGVLGYGSVQEEIRFCLCPELIVGQLLAESMEDNECIIITGVEQYSTSTGYASGYTWVGDFVDMTPRDEWRRRRTQIVAMDAIPFRRSSEQYAPRSVRRELNKAFCGFFCNFDPDHAPAIATGNWGCGAFNGNPVLKGLIQLMAAAALGRDICYFTFNDDKLLQTLHQMHSFIKEKNLQICDLWKIIVKYNREVVNSKNFTSNREGIFGFMKQLHSDYNESTDEEMS